MGAALATYVGIRLGGPGPLVILCLLGAGVVGGALWAGIASGLLYWRRVPEVLTTLLLITVASQVTGYGLKVHWLLLAPLREELSVRNPPSEQLAADTRLPRISLWGNDFPISAIAVICMAAIVFLPVQADGVGLPHQDAGPQPPNRPASRGVHHQVQAPAPC